MKINNLRGELKGSTAVYPESVQSQCFFSWNIELVNLKNIHFHYLKKYFLGQSIQKIFYFILKADALLEPQLAQRRMLLKSVKRWFCGCFMSGLKHRSLFHHHFRGFKLIRSVSKSAMMIITKLLFIRQPQCFLYSQHIG